MNFTTLDNAILLRADKNGLKKIGEGSMLILTSDDDGPAIAVFGPHDAPPEYKGVQIAKEALRELERASAKIELILHPEGKIQ